MSLSRERIYTLIFGDFTVFSKCSVDQQSPGCLPSFSKDFFFQNGKAIWPVSRSFTSGNSLCRFGELSLPVWEISNFSKWNSIFFGTSRVELNCARMSQSEWSWYCNHLIWNWIEDSKNDRSYSSSWATNRTVKTGFLMVLFICIKSNLTRNAEAVHRLGSSDGWLFCP